MKRVQLRPLSRPNGKPFKIEGDVVELPIDPKRNVKYLFRLKMRPSDQILDHMINALKGMFEEGSCLIIFEDDVEVFELESVPAEIPTRVGKWV
jgi:hypothetical protein